MSLLRKQERQLLLKMLSKQSFIFLFVIYSSFLSCSQDTKNQVNTPIIEKNDSVNYNALLYSLGKKNKLSPHFIKKYTLLGDYANDSNCSFEGDSIIYLENKSYAIARVKYIDGTTLNLVLLVINLKNQINTDYLEVATNPDSDGDRESIVKSYKIKQGNIIVTTHYVHGEEEIENVAKRESNTYSVNDLGKFIKK